MKTYEQGIKDERQRILDLLIQSGKELYVISEYGKFSERRKAKRALLFVANTVQYIEDSANEFDVKLGGK